LQKLQKGFGDMFSAGWSWIAKTATTSLRWLTDQT